MIIEEKEFQCTASGGEFGECDPLGCDKCKWGNNGKQTILKKE